MDTPGGLAWCDALWCSEKKTIVPCDSFSRQVFLFWKLTVAPLLPLSLNTRTHTQLTYSSTTLHSNGKWTPLLLSQEPTASLHWTLCSLMFKFISSSPSAPDMNLQNIKAHLVRLPAHNLISLDTKTNINLIQFAKCIHFVGHWI